MPRREGSAQSLDATISRLRLLLAELTAKEAQYEHIRLQNRQQRNRIVTNALYSDAALDISLGLLRAVDERQRDVEECLDHLSLIRGRLETELESLQLTRRVEQTRAELAELERQQRELNGQASPLAEELASEIRRLRDIINEASERAARAIERSSRAS